MTGTEFFHSNLLEYMYMSTCVIATIAYIPQASRLLSDRSDSASVSVGTWLIWVYTGIVAFSYACLVNGDPLFMISTGMSLFGCLLVTGLLLFNRYGKAHFFGRTDISIAEVLFKRHPVPVPVTVAVPVPAAPVPHGEAPHSLA